MLGCSRRYGETSKVFPRASTGGKPLGSRLLAMPRAKGPPRELPDRHHSRGRWLEKLLGSKSKAKLYGKPRIFNDLLSSQPLCFNLFGELAEDLNLWDSSLLTCCFPTQGCPGHGLSSSSGLPAGMTERFTGDRSAFDVFVRYVDAAGRKRVS